VADLITTRASLVTCLAAPEALDALEGACRIAPDEALIVVAPNAADATVTATAAKVRPIDEHAMVVETTDAWSALTIAGDGARRLFSFVSALDLPDPEGFVQGDVGRLVAKVLVRRPGDRITVFVPAPQAHALRERFIGLGAIPRPDPEPWNAT
jgi:sarcosine oxidase gamma subunit